MTHQLPCGGLHAGTTHSAELADPVAQTINPINAIDSAAVFVVVGDNVEITSALQRHTRTNRQTLLAAGRGQTSGSASVSAAVEAAAVLGAATASWQLWRSYGRSHAGPQGWPAHFPPFPKGLHLLLPLCQAGHSLCAHPTGLLLPLLMMLLILLLPASQHCHYSGLSPNDE